MIDNIRKGITNLDFELLFSRPTINGLLNILLTIFVGLFVMKLGIFVFHRLSNNKFSLQTNMLVKKVITYTAWVIILTNILGILGLDLNILLGAAGIIGIAVGFAAQTSVSNLISGIFLISEKPFQIGDVITVNNTTGTVTAIDLLSIKIKTFDNRLVRLPNETIIKTELTNVTKYPIRRLDMGVSVAYKEDLQKVKDLLLDIAKNNEYCLDNPEPFFIIKEFASSSIDMTLGIWFMKADIVNAKNSMMMEIKRRFDEEGVEIPFPHLSLYAGEKTKPFVIESK